MHLKSLTLKGFKSFASATTLRFEPGITAIVGPNGSGKSNVVDAMAWVLGEQGAKALRGGKMDDVIFAGTADRPPLGRAEVTLTIDNRDGALPIDFAEVSITRRMFRDGAGEYEINGKACRLLDIQELLSDSGIGREMHVIVGQGHLDAVLQARPEDRRAFIEEAAGVLKHRKRKEKALRKLDAMQVNLTRLTDLTAELRRQLGPLGRQAEVARRAVGVQAELRDSRLRLLADDVATLRTEIEADAEAEAAASAYRTQVQRELASATEAGDRAAADLAAATPALTAAQNVYFSLSALLERFRGTLSLAEERARHLAAPMVAAPTGRDPAELLVEAERAEAEQAEKQAAVVAADAAMQAVVARRTELETALAAAQTELAAAARAAADRREGLALLAGKVGSARSRLAAGRDEMERLSTAIADGADRADVAERDFAELRDSIGALDSSEVDLDALHEAAEAAHEAARARVAELTTAGRELASQQGALRARVEALALGLDRRDGAGALLAARDDLPGLLGSVAALIEVAPGAEAAIAAALGPAADAVATGSVEAAARALGRLQASDAGRAGIVVGGPVVGGAVAGNDGGLQRGALPAGATWAGDLVRAPAALAPAVDALLTGVVVVDGLAEATALVAAHPALTAVTRDGDLLSATWAFGGSRGKQSALEIQAAVDDAQAQLAAVTTAVAVNEAVSEEAAVHAEKCRIELDASLAALHESDATIAAVSEQLAQLGSVARAARAEVTRLQERRTQAESALEESGRHVAELEARLAAAESDEAPEDGDPARRDELAAAVEAQRQVELDARLALRTVEERARAGAGAADRLRRSAAAEQAARAAAELAATRRIAGARIAERVAAAAREALQRLDRSVASAGEERVAQEAARAAAEQAVTDARRTLAELQHRWDQLTDSVHSTEVLRAGQRLKLEQLAEVAQAEFALTVDDLVGEYGPQVLVPPSPDEIAEFEAAKERGETVTAPIAMPFDRASTERRAKRAARDFAALGRINPLALEEFSAMEERYAFLATQLEDLKGTRKDLLAVIDEVDAKILELFASAYHDVAAEFITVFASLFPGGEGSLQLTDPDDMLATGIEVLARPPGKKVKRLSLLSGGERSLVAVALLVAIFRARPSPFYVLDEVEAALDEVNLTRLVGLLRELRTASQLLIITHQKFTMEAADVLYGVSMRGDGISQVISQRMTGNHDGTAHDDTAAAPADAAAAPADAAGSAADDDVRAQREQGHAATAGVPAENPVGTRWTGETTAP